jgi:hypothetical protein
MAMTTQLWSRENLAWAAGLFDGEGSVMWSSATCNGQIKASMKLTDEDVLRRFHEVIGLGKVTGPYSRTGDKAHYKPCWYWTITGHQNVQAVMAALWHWLGIRRRAKAKEVLAMAASQRLSNAQIKKLAILRGWVKSSPHGAYIRTGEQT